ncbi:MAG: winged helix DNA-binding domain-containing protein [Negativicutes bacterium]|nr:winged helix DNA-binding domain-containing protein [Negativicutes bacterium]
MTISLSSSQLLFLRLRSQSLAPRPAEALAETSVETPAQVVKALCGLQAQVLTAAEQAVGVRSSGLTLADVEQARLQERSIIWTWGMRGTLHLLAASDLAWLLPLVGPVFLAGDQKRSRQLGLDEETAARGVRLLAELLANQGPQTRQEIALQLGAQGIPMQGQASIHLIARAAAQGLICHGPERQGEPGYVLLQDWCRDETTLRICASSSGVSTAATALPPESALDKLARRYLAAYGPAGAADLAAWSGLSPRLLRDALARIATELIEVEIAGRLAWLPKSHLDWLDEFASFEQAPAPLVRLLPRFDTYLLGYASRQGILAPEYTSRINAGGGMIAASLLVNGRILGTWSTKKQRQALEVIVAPFSELSAEVWAALEPEVAALGRFLGGKAVLGGAL